MTVGLTLYVLMWPVLVLAVLVSIARGFVADWAAARVGEIRSARPRSSIAWLSGLIVSRGMSQVSAIMLAICSNVEDIIKPLIY